ncbi:PTS sugar transporter subunit IIB [Limoniibacter endophyticus]|uniref:PTS galactitol transporter subunit IIB n=1 Tax=Limoniibacter endophyticus TaxID=1565040 RepID=A0A8J3GF30_9HYPH|nr:PTS sugar transporter subunit IIB [Limoniibacter endophyticus]GHC64303.1 PTS galactitol transporter subunit IIB [Limoniibacter endophyticus]
MAKQKTILFVCGTGVATSTVANTKTTEEMKKRGLTFEAKQCKASEVASQADGADLIVATTFLPSTPSIPVIKGLGFLTGIGLDKIYDDIEAELRK